MTGTATAPAAARLAELEAELAHMSRRRLRRHAARNAFLLELREAAYRRLLVRNARLEADRRFVESVATIITSFRANPGPTTTPVLAAICARFDELVVEHAAHDEVIA